MTDNVVIAHGGDVSQPSGGTNRVTAFAAGLNRNGYDVTLVVPTPTQELPQRLEGVDTSFVSVSNSGVADQPIRAARITRRAKSIASELNATVQFEHSTLGGVGQLIGHRDYVLDMHDLAFESPLYGDLPLGSVVQRVIRRIEGRAVQSASQIVVVSENMKQLVRDEWNLTADDIHVIPNGYFIETVSPFQTAETIPGRVTFLGTLHPKLDAEAIFEIAELSEVKEMIVIGGGAKESTLREGKRTRGLDDLRIEGRLPDEEAFSLLAESAVAINPQHPSSLQRASSPVKLYYYAAFGLPMILSEGPSLASQLEAKGAATVVEHREAFADAVREVLADGETRTQMGKTAKDLASDLSWEQRVETLTGVHG
jgi:glycosyltransferase involved in cell wall biosynthesis